MCEGDERSKRSMGFRERCTPLATQRTIEQGWIREAAAMVQARKAASTGVSPE